MGERAAWREKPRATNLAQLREAQASVAALLAVDRGVRCPHCDKKLGDYLAGVYRTTCPRCHREVTITR